MKKTRDMEQTQSSPQNNQVTGAAAPPQDMKPHPGNLLARVGPIFSRWGN